MKAQNVYSIIVYVSSERLSGYIHMQNVLTLSITFTISNKKHKILLFIEKKNPVVKQVLLKLKQINNILLN